MQVEQEIRSRLSIMLPANFVKVEEMSYSCMIFTETTWLIPPVAGSVERGEFVSVGYFEQESVKGNQNTALEELWQEYPGMSNSEVRGALAACGLTNDHITTKMTALSGGEAAKVRLCKIMQRPVNLLVLDEPTNHLDVEAKAELQRALQEYKGTLLLVSHEPEFYEGWIDQVWNIEGWSTKIV